MREGVWLGVGEWKECFGVRAGVVCGNDECM